MPGADGNFLTAAISGVIFVMSHTLHVKIQKHAVILFQPFSYAGSMDGSVSQLAHHFVPDWNILTTVGFIAMNLCQGIHCSQKMSSNDFVQYLDFWPNSCKTIDILISLSCPVFNANADVSMLTWYSVHICFYNPSCVIRSQVDGFKPVNSQLALNASLTSPLYMQIYTYITESHRHFFTQRNKYLPA